FGLLGSPFLLGQRPFAEFLAVLYPAWTAYVLVAGVLYALTWRTPRPIPSDVMPPVPITIPPGTRRRACLFVVVFLGLAWVRPGPGCWRSVLRRFLLLGGVPAFLLVGWLSVRRFRAAVGPLLRFTPEDDAPAPRLWTGAAIVLILLQAVSAAVYDRPDWDDC